MQISMPIYQQIVAISNIIKGHSGAELHIYFLIHLESIYYQIFFYSKIGYIQE